MRGAGRALFAAILLVVAGTLNIIYGIAAISEADFYGDTTVFAFAGLQTWGWVTLILGLIQLTGGFSLASGNSYGLVIGITGATLGAIVSLLAIGGPNPFWSRHLRFVPDRAARPRRVRRAAGSPHRRPHRV